MAIEYRRARSADLPQVASVFAAAIDDLNKRHGFFQAPTPASPPDPQYGFWLKKDPAAFWVAEDNRRVIGYSFSFLRGSVWYLADLFVLPRHQGRGVGATLIQKTLGAWKGGEIIRKALITPAFNPVSVSLYMRFGMLPRTPVYFASASRKSVAESLGSVRSRTLEADEVTDFSTASLTFDRIHRLALGFPAGWHNEFFSEIQRARCLLFKKNGRPEGYCFFRRDGRIGPLVLKSGLSFQPAVEAALRAAAEGESDELTIFFAGTNGAAVETSIRHGFKITYPLLFLSSRPMANFTNYLFYSPGLM